MTGGCIWSECQWWSTAAIAQYCARTWHPNPSSCKCWTENLHDVLLVTYKYVPKTLSCFSLRTPAVQYLWYKGSWLILSPHKGRAWREWCRGRHRRSTGTPGPAPTLTKDRWHLWVCCSAMNFSYWMILIECSVIYILLTTENVLYLFLVCSVPQNRSARTCCRSSTINLNRTKICRQWEKNSI